MFERIKCYKRLRRAELFLRGSVKLGEILNNEEMIQDSNHALNKIAYMKGRILFNRKLAKSYNLEFEKQGFK
jgi:hypothetical protein